MSPILRGSLVAAGLLAAFVAGFWVKPDPALPTAVAVAQEPPPVPVVRVRPDPRPNVPPPATAVAVAQEPPPVPVVRVRPDPRPNVPPPAPGQGAAPVVKLPGVRLPDLPDLPPPPAPEPIDPTDPALKWIKDGLGIQTTVLDKSEPVPAVLAAAQTVIKPQPMTGPTPPLEPTPRPAPPPAPFVIGPPDVQPDLVRLVNTRDVALDFQVTKTGTSPVTAVELWTTRDGGQTWAKTDRMAGCRSPFRTRLGSEGEYGLRLVFESESGMRSPEPKRGEKPALRLELDTMPPRVTVFPPEPASGQPGRVRFRWSASDAHLDAAHARLEYSPDGQVWQAIPDGNPAYGNGVYSREWTPPAGLPPRVMIRVTVRDTAGNSATVTPMEKVVIDLVAPEGTLTGVRSAAGAPEVGPMPREVAGGPTPSS